MKSLRAFFASRTGRLVLHDGAISAGVAVAYLETTAQPIDRGVLIAAGVLAVKAFLRLILPVPPAPDVKRASAPFTEHVMKISADTSQIHVALKQVQREAERTRKAVEGAAGAAQKRSNRS